MTPEMERAGAINSRQSQVKNDCVIILGCAPILNVFTVPNNIYYKSRGLRYEKAAPRGPLPARMAPIRALLETLSS